MRKIRKKVGLALGSGGVRGLAHVGVIKTLLKHNIPIDFIAGCSIGAWVGAHYALYSDIETLEELTVGKKKEKFLSFLDLSLGGGLIKGDKVQILLDEWLGKSTFARLQIPFQCVATDLVSGNQVIFHSGNLAFAVRASMAIPDLFKPIPYQKKVLVDGGIVNPVPDDIVKAMGADYVIAVNLDNYEPRGSFSAKDFSLLRTAWRSTELLRHYLAKNSMISSDARIEPYLADYASWTDYFVKDVGPETVIIGEQETEKIIPQIKKALGL